MVLVGFFGRRFVFIRIRTHIGAPNLECLGYQDPAGSGGSGFLKASGGDLVGLFISLVLRSASPNWDTRHHRLSPLIL